MESRAVFFFHSSGDDLRDVFELADADDNGKISPQEFRYAPVHR